MRKRNNSKEDEAKKAVKKIKKPEDSRSNKRRNEKEVDLWKENV